LSGPAKAALWLACGPLNLVFILLLTVAAVFVFRLQSGVHFDADHAPAIFRLLKGGLMLLIAGVVVQDDSTFGLSDTVPLVFAVHLIIFWSAVPFAISWARKGTHWILYVLTKCLVIGFGAYVISALLGVAIFTFGINTPGAGDELSRVAAFYMILYSAVVALPSTVYAALVIRLFGVRPGYRTEP
tara:strand:+ start:27677 stop:28234 length:558 start_codon:yes stop_codon:yes gene_type:complete